VVEKRRLGGNSGPAQPSELVVTCVGADLTTSAAGNPCIRWTFETDNGVRLAWTTVRRRRETGLAARALGMKYPPLRLADATGRKCRITTKQDGAFLNVEAARPL
jgi:hypothetical protein